jgi:hypothetical protein
MYNVNNERRHDAQRKDLAAAKEFVKHTAERRHAERRHA